MAKAASTQAMLEKEKPKKASAPSVEIPLPSSPKVTSTEKTEKEEGSIEDPEDSKKAGSTDYLSMLPEDWGTLHWVKKEKFIKTLTDKGFIEFILSVETIKAVQNACTERLKELG